MLGNCGDQDNNNISNGGGIGHGTYIRWELRKKGTHVLSKICILICLGHSLRSTGVCKYEIYFLKRPIFLDTRATYSGLPCNTSTMV